MKQIVEGETRPIVDTLYEGEGSARVAIDGSGLTVTLILRDRAGNTVQVAGNVDWRDASLGTVYYTPADNDLKSAGSPYAARWMVSDASGHAFYPNGEADKWVVRR